MTVGVWVGWVGGGALEPGGGAHERGPQIKRRAKGKVTKTRGRAASTPTRGPPEQRLDRVQLAWGGVECIRGNRNQEACQIINDTVDVILKKMAGGWEDEEEV